MSQINTWSPPSHKEEEMRKYVQDLDSAWARAQEDPLCLVVVADASVPSDSKFQATVAALIFGSGVQVGRITTAAGRRTPPGGGTFHIADWHFRGLGQGLPGAHGVFGFAPGSEHDPVSRTPVRADILP
jgi:hypothetical protein